MCNKNRIEAALSKRGTDIGVNFRLQSFITKLRSLPCFFFLHISFVQFHTANTNTVRHSHTCKRPNQILNHFHHDCIDVEVLLSNYHDSEKVNTMSIYIFLTLLLVGFHSTDTKGIQRTQSNVNGNMVDSNGEHSSKYAACSSNSDIKCNLPVRSLIFICAAGNRSNDLHV